MKKTREEWLNAAVDLLRPLFKQTGHTIPKKVRVSLGWPKGNIKKVAGECWDTKASEEKYNEIFISPKFNNKKVSTSDGIIATLIHELCHAVAGVGEGHKAAFKKVAVAVGLEGKMTSTTASKELLLKLGPICKKLGPFPHAAIKTGAGPIKKQSTRLIKVECTECGYIARITRMWLTEVGAPICPTCKIPFKECD